MLLPAGTRIGRYQVDACVGSGGMGEVYRARDTLLDRVVAIKLLPPGSGARSALEHEARAAAGLSHPHICTVTKATFRDPLVKQRVRELVVATLALPAKP